MRDIGNNDGVPQSFGHPFEAVFGILHFLSSESERTDQMFLQKLCGIVEILEEWEARNFLIHFLCDIGKIAFLSVAFVHNKLYDEIILKQ